jgi:hypothetical protein
VLRRILGWVLAALLLAVLLAALIFLTRQPSTHGCTFLGGVFVVGCP